MTRKVTEEKVAEVIEKFLEEQISASGIEVDAVLDVQGQSMTVVEFVEHLLNHPCKGDVRKTVARLKAVTGQGLVGVKQ